MYVRHQAVWTLLVTLTVTDGPDGFLPASDDHAADGGSGPPATDEPGDQLYVSELNQWFKSSPTQCCGRAACTDATELRCHDPHCTRFYGRFGPRSGPRLVAR